MRNDGQGIIAVADAPWRRQPLLKNKTKKGDKAPFFVFIRS